MQALIQVRLPRASQAGELDHSVKTYITLAAKDCHYGRMADGILIRQLMYPSSAHSAIHMGLLQILYIRLLPLLHASQLILFAKLWIHVLLGSAERTLQALYQR